MLKGCSKAARSFHYYIYEESINLCHVSSPHQSFSVLVWSWSASIAKKLEGLKNNGG